MGNKYELIACDPPWQYQNYAAPPGETHDRARGAQKHYPTMTLDDLKTLPISQLATDNCIMFMWSVWPLIEDAFELIKAWGFTYKTLAFDWVKWNAGGIGVFVGMGNYSRGNSEPCLLAFKGDPVSVSDHSVSAITFSPVEKHSKKPQAVYDKIERLYPSQTKLELFARNKRDGWDVWGNEVSNDVAIG